MNNQKTYCPNCGGENLQTIVKTDVQTYGKNYSASQGCCGALLFGPLGILCGACGQGQHTTSTNTSMFVCNDCGHEFKRREDLMKTVETWEKSKKLTVPLSGIAFFIMFLFGAGFFSDGDEVGIWFFICLCAFAITALLGYFLYQKLFDRVSAELKEYDMKQKRFNDGNNSIG